VCCSNTKCRSSNTQQRTCGGNVSGKIFQFKQTLIFIYLFIYLLAIQNVIITYDLPMGMMPVYGLLSESFIEVTEKIVR